MSSPEQISDDDESFEQDQSNIQRNPEDTIEISSDEDTIPYLTSDEELPEVNIQRSAVIKSLFPDEPGTSRNLKDFKYEPRTSYFSKQVGTGPTLSSEAPKVPGFEKMIGGVKVHLPVEPYGCQTALMFKVITAINRSQNCLLESPTGSGKTLALLCGALAWQQQEIRRMALAEAQQCVDQFPELKPYGDAVDYIASPQKQNVSPEKLFGVTTFGEKSIYDKPPQSRGCAGASNDHEPGTDCSNGERSIYDKPVQNRADGAGARNGSESDMECYDDDSPRQGEVSIHKKRRLNSAGGFKAGSPQQPVTPEKPIVAAQPETPEKIRALYSLVESLHLRTAMFLDCRTPIIYYGARTHKQLQQVIKEFGRTSYCGAAKMTVLSSREYSCIREFDSHLWPTKNDMCRGCVKKVLTDTQKKKGDTNCKYYNNVKALDHSQLPPAFDLEDLVAAGHEKSACPYFAARAMAQNAQIVFCPYNYLIEPGIRSSMQIDLKDNIVIIDEAHNIEDICRSAATFTITQDKLQECIKELDYCCQYRFANQDAMHYLNYILDALRSWDQWFQNQLPLVANKAVNNNEAVHTWEMNHFVTTLDNHNIGQKHYNDFGQSAEALMQKLRDSPETLYGVTQATGTLVEGISTVLGYIFSCDGKYKNDFKPALIRNVSSSSTLSESKGWRTSHFNKWVDKDTLSLRFLCLNPAVVFEGLKTARCILLASGTLTPLVSLHSELATQFPLQVSPNHVIPQDRVWIGTLTTCPNGQPLLCNSRGTSEPTVQDALGDAVEWVCQVTPNGVLAFLPSYALLNRLHKRWQETGLWHKLNNLKHVFMESSNVREHNDVMDDYYKYTATSKGALLFAVYRGKVSEGMDFKDHQARAVITIGVPYPNMLDIAVKEKMNYNDRYCAQRSLLTSKEWLRVQAYRALNQAVGRCVRHRNDWGAVLLVDSRFTQAHYTEHLSKWVRNFLGNNHHTFESLVNSPNSLESFMQNMVIRENEDV